jgi:hypothetical protein
MTVVLVIVIVALLVAIGYLGRRLREVERPAKAVPGPADAATGRILFPFGAPGPTASALDVALRLARAESETLVPVFLARVALHLPLNAALPRQAGVAMPVQEAIEQRAAVFGVPVDSRIERGRSYRHALRQTIEHERFDRIVVAAASGSGDGFDAEDIAWLLRNAPGEILVLRPARPEGDRSEGA